VKIKIGKELPSEYNAVGFSDLSVLPKGSHCERMARVIGLKGKRKRGYIHRCKKNLLPGNIVPGTQPAGTWKQSYGKKWPGGGTTGKTCVAKKTVEVCRGDGRAKTCKKEKRCKKYG
jgi:hypothetical protein